MAWRLAQQMPGIERLAPSQGKDWNESLMYPKRPQESPRCQTDHVLLHRLWQWYGAAHALGRQEAYLKRITEVAKESIKGQSLSPKARVAMKADMTRFSQQVVKERELLSPVWNSLEV